MVTSTCSLHVSLDDQSESSTSSRYPIPIHLGGSCSDHELLVAGPMESTPHWAPSQSHSTTGPPPPSVPSSSSSEPDNLPAVVAMAGSSANSILSASGTLVSESVRRRSSSSTTVQPHDISRSSTTQTLATAVHSAALDPQHIKAMMNDLNKHLERFEELNNQVLEAMTSYDRHNLGLDTDQGRLLSTPSAESLPPRSVGFETSSQDLERQRQATALSAAELIQALWPRLRPGSTSTDIHTPHMYQQTSSKAAKQRVKIATQLKNAITTLWSSQSIYIYYWCTLTHNTTGSNRARTRRRHQDSSQSSSE
ncbi:hypothetical protein B0O80DRAFT_438255 [Mortierella sp. GBAus27b]|nr:hypothetical protein B0O80DRAFT_438255 [Mortierella sp. GBAus27b]